MDSSLIHVAAAPHGQASRIAEIRIEVDGLDAVCRILRIAQVPCSAGDGEVRVGADWAGGTAISFRASSG